MMLYGQLQVLQTLLISDELRRHKCSIKWMSFLSAIFRHYFTIRLLNEYQIHFLLHVYGERKVAVLKTLHTVKYSELQKSYFSFKSLKAICWWQFFLLLEVFGKKISNLQLLLRCTTLSKEKKRKKKTKQNLSSGGIKCVGRLFSWFSSEDIHSLIIYQPTYTWQPASLRSTALGPALQKVIFQL